MPLSNSVKCKDQQTHQKEETQDTDDHNKNPSDECFWSHQQEVHEGEDENKPVGRKVKGVSNGDAPREQGSTSDDGQSKCKAQQKLGPKTRTGS